MTSQTGTTRRGYSLAEMLVVLTIVSIVTSTGAIVLHTVFRADAQLRADLATTQSLDRLANQLRSDAHAADGLQPIEATSLTSSERLLLLFPDDGMREYRSEAGGVTRIVRRGEQIEHRDTFRLDPRFRVRFSNPTHGPRTLLTMSVEASPESNGVGPWKSWFRVETIVGLDWPAAEVHP